MNTIASVRILKNRGSSRLFSLFSLQQRSKWLFLVMAVKETDSHRYRFKIRRVFTRRSNPSLRFPTLACSKGFNCINSHHFLNKGKIRHTSHSVYFLRVSAPDPPLISTDIRLPLANLIDNVTPLFRILEYIMKKLHFVNYFLRPRP